MPLPAALYVPEFLRQDRQELAVIYDVLRDMLVSHLYSLILMQSQFTNGHFLGSYARLIELSTPPKPERGRRRQGPSLKQVRNAIDDMVRVGLVRRGDTNEAQGQLRLWVTPRKKIGAPVESEGRVLGRVRKSAKPMPERAREDSAPDIGQGSGQGYQGVNTNPLTPSKDASYPQSLAVLEAKAKVRAILAQAKSSPPESGGKGGAPRGHKGRAG